MDGGTQYRVSNQGNVFSAESPTGYEHIDVGSTFEGYVLCYTPPSSLEVQAYDSAFTSTGFGTATHSTGSPWTVTRSTSDGKVQLKQVFTFNGTSKSLNVAMTVKNLTGSTLGNVIVARVADFDVDVGGVNGFAFFSDNWFAATDDSVFAWNDPGSFLNDTHGMILRHVKQPGGTNRFVLYPNNSTDCHTGGGTTPVQGDLTAWISYQFASGLAAGASKTVTIQYVRD